MDNLQGLDSEQLANLTKIIYIPGPGVPGHEPMWFGHPFNVSLKPNVILDCEGSMAKALCCHFPKRVFLVGLDGKPRSLTSKQCERLMAGKGPDELDEQAEQFADTPRPVEADHPPENVSSDDAPDTNPKGKSKR